MNRFGIGKEFWLAALRTDAAAFLAAVGEQDVLARPVPSCPDWAVGDLTQHLGTFFHRLRRFVGVNGPDERWPPYAIPEEAPAPDDPAVVTWCQEQFARFEAHMEALDPDTPTYHWAPRARVAAFWHRRAAHETAVHRWDAQLAVRLPEPIDSKLAADTIAEALDTFLPAGPPREPDPAAEGLIHLSATDLGLNWYVRLRGAGVALLDTDTLLDGDAPQARASAFGTASDLALALWGRVPFEVGEVSGQAELLEAIRVR